MPEVKRRESAGSAAPAALTIPQLRVLGELADGGGMTSGRVEAAAGSSSPCAGLAVMGLLEREDLDLDGGKAESVWTITPAGRAAWDRSAKPAAGAGRPGMASAPSAKVSRNGRKQEDADGPAIGAIAPWFGAARKTAAVYGEAFRGIAWVGIPFCGSLPEVPAMLDAGVNAIALNDRHRHLINMARVMACPDLGARMHRLLRRMPFSAEALREAQAWCAANEPGEELCLTSAVNYFVCAWMGRSAEAGTKGEFRAGLAIRYGAGGGNSVLRFANAVGGIRAWRRILSRCSFSSDDGFEFLARCNDRADGGVYADPPWPVAGDAYKHRFGPGDHARLAAALGRFRAARVVLRTSRMPELASLYQAVDGWEWLEVGGRDQANAAKTEWLVRRN